MILDVGMATERRAMLPEQIHMEAEPPEINSGIRIELTTTITTMRPAWKIEEGLYSKPESN